GGRRGRIAAAERDRDREPARGRGRHNARSEPRAVAGARRAAGRAAGHERGGRAYCAAPGPASAPTLGRAARGALRAGSGGRAPPAPTIERLDPCVVRAVVRALAADRDTVIIDLSALDATSLAALQMAGIVLVVMTDDLCSVQTAQQTLGALPALGIERERIGV